MIRNKQYECPHNSSVDCLYKEDCKNCQFKKSVETLQIIQNYVGFKMRKVILGICGKCTKKVYRILKNNKQTWIIVKMGIYHRECYFRPNFA